MVTTGNSAFYYPLSANQGNIWNLECLYSGTPINVITTEIRFSNRIHYSLIQEAINIVLERDVSLRTRITLGEDGVPVQYTIPFERETFPLLDFSMTDGEGVHHWASTVSREPIPLYDSPLYRFMVFRADGNTAGILVRMHHIISDGWTQLMLCNRIGQTYLELVEGMQPTLSEAPPYKEHLEAEREYFESEEFQNDKEFWAGQLEQAGAATTIKTFKGNAISPIGKRKGYKLPQTLNHAIYTFCMENRIAPFSVFYIALATYLARITGERTLTLGVPVFNRMNFSFKQTSGMFVSTLPLVYTVDEEQTFDQSFKLFGEHWMETLRHQRFPFSEILKLRKQQDDLFQIVLSYQDGTMLQSGESSVRVSGNWYYSGCQREHLCIHMTNLEENRKYAIDYDYLTQIFTEREIDQIHSHLCHILKTALENSTRTTDTLLPLNDELKETVLYTFNRSSKPLHYQSPYEIFSGVEARYPNRVALIESGQRISYSTLRFRAGEIASALDSPGKLVAVLLPKGIPLFTAIIATLQAGCAFLLISPDLPAARISEIIDDSGADSIITNSVKYCFAGEFGIPVINVDQPGAYVPAASAARKDDLAYVVYTSGSTGKPKGVEITCLNLVNLVQAMRPYYSKDAVLSICNIEFDAFMLESIVPMLLGRTIVIPERNQLEDPRAMANLILGYGVGFLATTPSRLAAYLADKDFMRAVARLESIVCGGESITEDLVAKLRHLTNAHVYNQYGPSETCVAVSIARVSDMPRITAGKPMDNCRLYILDKWMQPLPVGVFGDLYIGGLCVGRGYRNNRELTEQRFPPNPYEANDRLYRTGDLACWTAEGEIVLSGRMDKQVKVRGIRIELEDISSCLAGFSGVRESAAKVFDVRNQGVIIAYYTAEEELRETDLLRFMGEQLPYYMLPSRILRLEEMPLTSNGKADENRLPFPEETEGGRAPSTRLQEEILRIFMETLERSDLNLDSDYFLSGGNSLNAMETIARIENLIGTRLKIADLYSLRTAGLIAEELEGAQRIPTARKDTLQKAPTQERCPASSIQKGIYLQSSLDPTGLAYNMPGAFTIDGPLNPEALRDAFQKLVDGDDIFRMNFALEDGELWQIPKKQVTVALETVSGEDVAQTAADFLRPFDLGADLLVRLGLHQPAEGPATVFFDIHHIICDGLSTPVIMKRLSASYEGRKYTVPYVYWDYLWHQQEKKTSDETREYWRRMVSEPPHPAELPGNRQRPEHPGFGGGRVFLSMSKEASERIERFCMSNKLTPFMFFAGAMGIFLSRYSGQQDFFVGTPVSKRDLPEYKEICGPFLETLPLRLSPAGPIQAYLGQVRDNVAGLLDNADISLEEIMEASGLPRSLSGNALFRMLISMRPLDAGGMVFGGMPATLRPVDNGTAKMDLSLEIAGADGKFGLFFEYAKDLFDQDTASMFARSFEAVAMEILAAEISSVEEISAIAPPDWIKYIERPARRAAPFLQMPLNEIISGQCSITPLADAVVCGENRISFSEFHARALEIAGLLRQQGINPGDKVGVVLRRNLDLLPALTAILMAGASYVPFLESQPEKRILYMMENAGVNLILHDEETKHAVGHLNFDLVDIRTPSLPLEQIHRNKMEDAIHILYTSGSTGVPKGVQLPHRAIANLLENIKEIMVMNTGKVLCSSNMTFDVFITESLLALAQGFSVVLADDGEMMLPHRLGELILQNGVGVIQFTPSRLQVCMQNKRFKESLADVELAIVAGENMPASLVSEFKGASRAQLVNLYGPTEAAVYVTQGELFADEPVTIGRPLNNCRVYIMDEELRILPPLARGEICIGGICLADGYVGCDDLTEKLFVPDPVVPGARMYRSGDLGALNLDGSILCMGRRDAQVKVNGVRVEPQEIVEAMIRAGAAHGAVLPLKNQDGSMALYGFIAPETLEPQRIREALHQELPPYMIPTEIIALEQIPHNHSGKTDLRKLEALLLSRDNQLEIPLESQDSRNPDEELAYESQIGEGDPLVVPDASAILAIWERTLGKRGLDSSRSFFEQGGTSLGALGILGQYYNQGFTMTMADFYRYPTASGQAALLAGRYDGDNPAPETEGKTEAELSLGGGSGKTPYFRYVPQATARSAKSTGPVFLTGGSGFLGSHLLRELIETDSGTVRCLVRPGRLESFFGTLESYFGKEWTDRNKARIQVLEGDLTKKHLGLKKQAYEALASDIGRIYHCAADVRHYAPTKEMMDTNVKGTHEVIQLALIAQAAMHHISTTSVAADYITGKPDEKAVFFEMDFDIGQNMKQNIYVHSKFLAEQEVYEAIGAGLDARVYRVGRLVGRSSDGLFQKNPESNAFYAFLRAIRLAGAIPESMSEAGIELTPVDECARAILTLSDSRLTTFHLASVHRVPVKQIVALAQEIRIVPDAGYQEILAEFSRKNPGPAGMPLLDYIAGRQGDRQQIEVSAIITQNELASRGYAWQEPDPGIVLKDFFPVCTVTRGDL